MKSGVSIVILTRNSQTYIHNCLRSIQSNVNLPHEVIVVDNGSTDETKKIIAAHEGVKLIELKANHGTTMPRNLGVKYAKVEYPYLCFLDSDTIVETGTFEKLLGVFEIDHRIGLVVPFLYMPNGKQQNNFRKFPTLFQKLCKVIPNAKIKAWGHRDEMVDFNLDSDKPFDTEYAISACWVLPKRVFYQVGEFDEKIFYAPEDVDFCLRLWKSGYHIVVVPGTSIIHYLQRISQKNPISKISLSHLLGLIYCFNKHNYWFSRGSIYKQIGMSK